MVLGDGNQIQPTRGNAWVPPRFRDKTVDIFPRHGRPPTLAQSIARIHAEADPIGFLIAVMEGTPIATYVIEDDGTVTTHFETASLKLREKVAEKLAAHILPRISIQKKIEEKEKEGDATKEKDPYSFEGLIDRTTRKGQDGE